MTKVSCCLKKQEQEYHLLQPIASDNIWKKLLLEKKGTRVPSVTTYCQFIHMKLHWDTCWSRDPTVIWCWTAAFIHTTMRETHTTQLWWHLQWKYIEGLVWKELAPQQPECLPVCKWMEIRETGRCWPLSVQGSLRYLFFCSWFLIPVQSAGVNLILIPLLLRKNWTLCRGPWKWF
jgi:hypothetical protein